MIPFRLSDDSSSAAFPAECEPQCRHADALAHYMNGMAYAEMLKAKSRTRDERQCRGCGRWGLFELRAIKASPQYAQRRKHE